MNETELENQINAAGATEGRRVEITDVNDAILSAHYVNIGAANKAVGSHVLSGNLIRDFDLTNLSTITHCTLILKNGYTVTGESVCVDPKNFKEEIGRSIAYNNARDKIWGLLGFALKSEITNTKLI